MIKISTLIFCILLLFQSSFAQQKTTYNKRLLVIGGGGARGAWGGGFVQRLDSLHGHYPIVFGTSTGSLLAPLIVLDSFSRLKTAYTTVQQSDIFNDNPFNDSGNLKGWNAFRQAITGEQSFGTTHNLRNKLINKFLTTKDYDLLKATHKLKYIVTVVNMKTAQVEYKSSDDNNVSMMKNWMWAAANEPLFMSYYNYGPKPYVPYCDGGVLANVPLVEALQYADSYDIDTIDVVINKPVYPITDTTFQNRNILHGLERLITLWETQIRNDNVEIGILEALSSASESLPDYANSRKIVITIHYYPSSMYVGIFQKELMIDSRRMTSLWDSGQKGIEDKYVPETGVIEPDGGHTIIIATGKKGDDSKPIRKYLKKYQHQKMVREKLYTKNVDQ